METAYRSSTVLGDSACAFSMVKLNYNAFLVAALDNAENMTIYLYAYANGGVGLGRPDQRPEPARQFRSEPVRMTEVLGGPSCAANVPLSHRRPRR